MTVVVERNHPEIRNPTRRSLRAFAFDPMSTRLSGRCLTVDVTFEELQPGPVGELVQVVDFDGTREVWYRPVDLDDPRILAQGGLAPAESDPRTHQQVVYAVTMSVIERFERFLGRRFRWSKERALVLVPHAFEGKNAFFDPDRRAVLFGYFRAHDRDPGPNLPGQWMYTCLSMDIIAHEVTHAIVHRLRRYFSVASNRDVYAWHEAFADLVALFHHFAFPEVVAAAVASDQADLGKDVGLLDLALEFGVATGRGEALRSAIKDKTTPEQFDKTDEPHERGAIFVAAVFDAYLQTYRRRIADLLRIATGGTGVLPAGSLHPDLVARIADEAVENAERFLGIVVRAFDYLPVVDVRFGDVVRAIVTADRALYPDDAGQLRSQLVESLRERGIYPIRISSLADEAIAWPKPTVALRLTDSMPQVDLSGLIHSATQDLDTSAPAGDVRSDEQANGSEANVPAEGERSDLLVSALVAWANVHAVELGFDPSAGDIALNGVHAVYRQAADRQPRPEVVIQFAQRRRDLEDATVDEADRIAMRAGTTVIAGVDGTVAHVIAKPLPLVSPESVLANLSAEVALIGQAHHEAGVERLDAMKQWFDKVGDRDPLSSWTTEPAVRRLTFANLHAELVEEVR